MATTAHVERALFMIGDQNTGKSTQLRSMFRDWRLGKQGIVPTERNVQNACAISNERWLYLRLTSPHEAGETLDKFLDKCANEMQPNGRLALRWNVAGALQPTGTRKLAGAADVISAFAARFAPERIRAVILAADRFGTWMPEPALQSLATACRNVPSTEVMMIDATDRTASGLLYADFFDFT